MSGYRALGRDVDARKDTALAGREIAAERIDRLALWLEITLGPRLAAFAAGLSPRHLMQIAQGADRPSDDQERRLRNLFAVVSFLTARDGAGSAYNWLTEPNSELQGRTPAAELHEGTAPETVWLASATPF